MTNALTLLIDASSPRAVVALARGDVLLAQEFVGETKRHAEGLVDALDRALTTASMALSDVQAIAVGRGPGSFIGVRTGIAFAQGLAAGLAVDVVGVPSLLALAGSVEAQGDGLCVTDAKRGEVFVQLVRAHAAHITPLQAPCAMTPAAAVMLANAAAFWVGSGLSEVVTEVAAFPLVGPTGSGLVRALRCAPHHDATVLPEYCRNADAKLPLIDPAARRSEFDSGTLGMTDV